MRRPSLSPLLTDAPLRYVPVLRILPIRALLPFAVDARITFFTPSTFHHRCLAVLPVAMFVDDSLLWTLQDPKLPPPPLAEHVSSEALHATSSPHRDRNIAVSYAWRWCHLASTTHGTDHIASFSQLPAPITTRYCDAPSFFLASAHRTLTSRTPLNSSAAYVIKLCSANHRS